MGLKSVNGVWKMAGKYWKLLEKIVVGGGGIEPPTSCL